MRSIKSLFGISSEPLNEFESQLDFAFTPVAPRTEFVDTLRSSLRRQWELPVEAEPISDSARMLLIGVAAFLAGTVALVMGIRAVIALLGSLGLLHQMKNQLPERGAPPLRPAA